MSFLLDKDTMTESELKRILSEIKYGEKNWSEVNNLSVVKSMIEHIGSTNGELRDQLIYTCFYRLIAESNQLETDLLIELMDTCLNELLFKGIGENGTDAVFTRAFTTLLIALILYSDNLVNFLSGKTLYETKEKLVQYINLEEDLRGYVPDKGWSHAIAHVADTFEELIKSPKISRDFYTDILKALWNKILVSNSVYIHDEDERILIPIIEMLENGLETEEIEKLLQNLPLNLEARKEQLAHENYWFLISNSKTFLKSFYMKINRNSKLASLQKSIEQCLTKI